MLWRSSFSRKLIFILLERSVKKFFSLVTSFLFISIAELKVNKRPDTIFGILHGECYFKSSTRPGTDGLADWFSRFQFVTYIGEFDTRNCPCFARPLSRTPRSCNTLQPTQVFWTILYGELSSDAISVD